MSENEISDKNLYAVFAYSGTDDFDVEVNYIGSSISASPSEVTAELAGVPSCKHVGSIDPYTYTCLQIDPSETEGFLEAISNNMITEDSIKAFSIREWNLIESVNEKEQLFKNINKRSEELAREDLLKIANMKSKTERLELNFSRHLNVEPSNGFMASKNGHRVWENYKTELQDNLRQAQRDLKTARSEFNMNSELRQFKAEKMVRQENPELSARVDLADATERAENLIEHWERLGHELADNDTPGAQRSLAGVLKDIEKSNTAMEMLSKDDKAHLQESMKQSNERNNNRGMER